MFDHTMKKKKKKKKVPLDLDALEETNAPSNVDEKNENPPENENRDNVATEEKEDKEDTGTQLIRMMANSEYLLRCAICCAG